MLHEDLEMRRVILARLRNAGIAKIETERSSNAQLTVTIHTAKPGIVIGKGGASVDQLRVELRLLDLLDRAPHQLQARDEAGNPAHDALRRQGRKDLLRRPPAGR